MTAIIANTEEILTSGFAPAAVHLGISNQCEPPLPVTCGWTRNNLYAWFRYLGQRGLAGVDIWTPDKPQNTPAWMFEASASFLAGQHSLPPLKSDELRPDGIDTLVTAIAQRRRRSDYDAAPSHGSRSNSTDGLKVHVGAPLNFRPWLGVGYDVLAFDFKQAQQPLVAATFKKRWTDANASWARMVDPSTFWDFNTTRFVKDYAALFRDTTNTSLFWTQWAEGQWQPTAGLPNPGNSTAVAEWAGDRAEFISSLVVAGNVSNLEYYCFSNEEEDVGPSKGWPGPNGNTSNFITYNRAVRKALDDIGGAVGAVKLVGTDFFPCKISLDGVQDEASIDSYDCHHYGDEGYDDFTSVLAPPLKISHAADKNFFLSEFGGPSCGGKNHSEGCPSGAPKGCKDSCAWFDTPDETQLGMVLAEKVLATINSGGQSTGYW